LKIKMSHGEEGGGQKSDKKVSLIIYMATFCGEGLARPSC